MTQRFDIEHGIRPSLKKSITLVHKSGFVVYVAQSAFSVFLDIEDSEKELNRLAHVIAIAIEQDEKSIGKN